MQNEILTKPDTELKVQSAPIIITLPTFFGMKTVNCFLFKQPEPILIDCGENTDENWEALNKGVEANGLKLSDIKKVYLTHIHLDHYGAAGRLADEFGTEIWMNEKMDGFAQDFVFHDKKVRAMRDLTFEKIANYNPSNIEDPFKEYLKTFNTKAIRKKVLKSCYPMPEKACNIYKIGDFLNFGNQQWEVIHTPGHSETQVVYYQKESKVMMSSDMIINITPAPFFEIKPDTENDRYRGLPIMMESYDKVKKLDFNLVYPGHFEIIDNPKEIIDSQVKQIHKRKEECLNHINEGTTDFLTLYFKMYKKFNIAAAVMLLGYVDLLEHEGKAKWIEDEETIRFEKQ